jgi:uncharacterized membrane protein
MSHTRRWDALSLASILGGSALTAAVQARLPAQVPVHFDLHGRVDGWMDAPAGAWLLPGSSLLAWGLVRFGARIAPHGARERMEASPMAAVGFLLAALLGAMQLIVLWAALHPGAPVGSPLAIALGAFWIVLGLVLPRVRRNPIVGVRTAWTLASDENWARTHRFSSYAFCLGGLVAVASAFAGGPSAAVVAILGSTVVPVAYSFVLAHRLPPA